MGKTVALDEAFGDEAYRRMLLMDEFKIRRKLIGMKNTGATKIEALNSILDDHPHPVLEPIVEKVFKEVYTRGS